MSLFSTHRVIVCVLYYILIFKIYNILRFEAMASSILMPACHPILLTVIYLTNYLLLLDTHALSGFFSILYEAAMNICILKSLRFW